MLVALAKFVEKSFNHSLILASNIVPRNVERLPVVPKGVMEETFNANCVDKRFIFRERASEMPSIIFAAVSTK